jgi:FkbM family methyltransferase
VGEIYTCKVRDLTIQIDLDSGEQKEGVRNNELWRATTYDEKEPDTLDWLDTFMEPGDVLYDIGANIGQYSLYAAYRLQKTISILSFEPEALNQAKLNKNIVLNDMVGVITPYPIAVSHETAIEHFYSKNFAPGAALHALGEPVTQGDESFPPQNTQGIVAVSLDDLTGKFALPFPTHIKVDVDGIEERIVAGASRTLDDPRLKSVLIEVYMHKDIAERIKEVFFAKGFELFNSDLIDYSHGIVQNLIFRKPTEGTS